MLSPAGIFHVALEEGGVSLEDVADGLGGAPVVHTGLGGGGEVCGW